MIKVIVAGDLVPGGGATEEHDFVDKPLLNILKDSDLTIANLECPITNQNEKTQKFGPTLKAQVNRTPMLTQMGIDLVTLANNHIMDYGSIGLEETLSCLNNLKIGFVGCGMTPKQTRKPYIFEANGIKLGIINITENEFIHGDRNSGANAFNFYQNQQDIDELKNNTDKVLVIYHGGNENYNLPSPRLQDTFRFFVNIGADIVIGHHTHCVSGWEIYNGSPIIYSIGNFIFDYNKRNDKEWATGCLVEILIDNEISFNLIPISQFYEENKVRLLSSEEQESFENKVKKLNSIINDRIKLEASFTDYVSTLSKQFYHFLQPTSNRILHALMSRKLIPSLAFGKRKLLHLNLVRCEAHRDVLLNLLKQK